MVDSTTSALLKLQGNRIRKLSLNEVSPPAPPNWRSQSRAPDEFVAHSVLVPSKKPQYLSYLKQRRDYTDKQAVATSPTNQGRQVVVERFLLENGDIKFAIGTKLGEIVTRDSEEVPLANIYDYVTPQELERFENLDFLAEDTREDLIFARKKQIGRPKGWRKGMIGYSMFAEGGDTSREESTAPNPSSQSKLTSRTSIQVRIPSFNGPQPRQIRSSTAGEDSTSVEQSTKSSRQGTRKPIPNQYSMMAAAGLAPREPVSDSETSRKPSPMPESRLADDDEKRTPKRRRFAESSLKEMSSFSGCVDGANSSTASAKKLAPASFRFDLKDYDDHHNNDHDLLESTNRTGATSEMDNGNSSSGDMYASHARQASPASSSSDSLMSRGSPSHHVNRSVSKVQSHITQNPSILMPATAAGDYSPGVSTSQATKTSPHNATSSASSAIVQRVIPTCQSQASGSKANTLDETRSQTLSITPHYPHRRPVYEPQTSPVRITNAKHSDFQDAPDIATTNMPQTSKPSPSKSINSKSSSSTKSMTPHFPAGRPTQRAQNVTNNDSKIQETPKEFPATATKQPPRPANSSTKRKRSPKPPSPAISPLKSSSRTKAGRLGLPSSTATRDIATFFQPRLTPPKPPPSTLSRPERRRSSQSSEDPITKPGPATQSSSNSEDESSSDNDSRSSEVLVVHPRQRHPSSAPTRRRREVVEKPGPIQGGGYGRVIIPSRVRPSRGLEAIDPALRRKGGAAGGDRNEGEGEGEESSDSDSSEVLVVKRR